MILCLKHKYEIFSKSGDLLNVLGFVEEQLGLCEILPSADNSPYPVWKGFVLRLLDNKSKGWGAATAYEQKA